MKKENKEIERIIKEFQKQFGFEAYSEYEPAIAVLFLSRAFLSYRNIILEEISSKVDWILTPHAYESDNPEMEKFARQIKEHYKKEIIEAIFNPPMI